jgi:ABC-type multidrug transport system ATPase subunit
MMTTGILDALMRLFALLASGRSVREAMLGRQVASRYLSGRLSRTIAEDYLKRYDEALDMFNRKIPAASDPILIAKRKSKLSVKLLVLCNKVKGELTVKDRLVVFIRLAELAKSTGTIDDSDSFLNAVGIALNLLNDDLNGIKHFVKIDSRDEALPFEMTGGSIFSMPVGKGHCAQPLLMCRTSMDDMFFVKDLDRGDLRLNGIPIVKSCCLPMTQGSVVKDNVGHSLFFSDILQHSSIQSAEHDRISFVAQDIAHFFKYPVEPALKPLSIDANEGQLIGIMGSSGSGKSTLLNILNGSQQPSFGRVMLNGRDIYADDESSSGLIGHIAQDDVLISELTVEENLRFSAELSLGALSSEELISHVDETLRSLGLWEIRDLRVGSILDKTISGGQRKRLNIALELIREPAVLFVDEPTSGLSSRDSEQIMDLLKELALRGKLIFVVIHQPSSDIFKLFDRLILLDAGGYPVFQGNPLQSLAYFKQLSNQVQSTDLVCRDCGTVNPESIFEIIEACMVDDYGQVTSNRRVSPEEWFDFYNVFIANGLVPSRVAQDRPTSLKAPSWRKQWKTYWTRDLQAKMSNRQYVLMNLLQAPVLAIFLATFTRFQDGGAAYSYRLSENLPQFLFISVIVSLFLGLSFSAEEIFRDRPLLRRERFLKLSWNAYLTSKIALMFSLSALQSFMYAGISILILKIPNAFGTLFWTLFGLSAFANLLGLNLSSAMRSAKTIYIMIPLLIIPQIIFGGAIIRFDRFNPVLTEVDRVSWIGNVMASRWGFEGIAVELTRNNDFDAPFIRCEDRLERSAWRRDFWFKSFQSIEDGQVRTEEWNGALLELQSWDYKTEGIETQKQLRDAFKESYKLAFSQRDSIRITMAENVELDLLKEQHHNETLHSWVMQTDRTRRVSMTSRGLVQETSFIHQLPLGRQAWNAPFYAPMKSIGPWTFSTSVFNRMMLWAMVLLMYVALVNRVPERLGWGRQLS